MVQRYLMQILLTLFAGSAFSASAMNSVADCFEAIKEGDLEKCQSFEGINLIDIRNGEGETALYVAAENGHVAVVQWLLGQAGVSDGYVWRTCGDTEQTRDIDSDVIFCASLDYAVPSGKTRRRFDPCWVERSFDESREIAAKEVRNGFTALDIAACNGHGPVCEVLVPEFKGAAKEIWRKVLLVAFRQDEVEACKALLPLADWDYFNERGINFLDCAARYNTTRMLEMFLGNEHQPFSIHPALNDIALISTLLYVGDVYGIKEHKEAKCRRIVSYVKNVNDGFRVFLCTLKYSDQPALQLLYTNRSALVYPFFMVYLKRVPASLETCLAQRDFKGNTAYDYVPIEELKPESARIRSSRYRLLIGGLVLVAMPLLYKFLTKNKKGVSSDMSSVEQGLNEVIDLH